MLPQNDVRRDAIELLKSLEHHPGCPLSDMRLPPPDILGHLADHQIYGSHLIELAQHIRENWPMVVRIDCGLRNRRYIYVAIRIDPYSHATARQHWKLADWIQENYPGSKDFLFYFLPPPEGNQPSPSTTIFPVPVRY